MPHDGILAELLDAIKPPVGNWSTSHTESVLALLVGAGAALFECRGLLQRHITEHSALTGSTWRTDTLYDEFKNAITPEGNVRWNHPDNFALWSMGFFLNKSQQNVAAALDRCVNAWLGLRFKMKALRRSEWVILRVF